MIKKIKKEGLSKKLLSQIVRIIIEYKRPEKIVIFGSRANADFRETSDVDIAILGKDWTGKDINLVKHDLDESIKVPLKFDVLNFYKITKSKLRENILKGGRVIYDSGKD